MPNALWPSDLPQLALDGTSIEDEDGTYRFETDSKVAKVRRRYTGTVTKHEVPLILTGAQAKKLRTFYRTTLQNGALRFDWVDALDDATVSFRFRSPPRIVLGVGGSTDDRLWRTTLSLEVVP